MSDRPRLTGSDTPRLDAPAAGGLRDRRTLDRLLLGLAVLSALLVGAGTLVEKHPYFEIEHLVGFHGIVGAGAAAAAVAVALALRPLIRRPEDYYDR